MVNANSQEKRARKEIKDEEYKNLIIRKNQFTKTSQKSIDDFLHLMGIKNKNTKIPKNIRFYTQYPNENEDCLQFIETCNFPKEKKSKTNSNSNNNNNNCLTKKKNKKSKQKLDPETEEYLKLKTKLKNKVMFVFELSGLFL